VGRSRRRGDRRAGARWLRPRFGTVGQDLALERGARRRAPRAEIRAGRCG